MSRFEDWEIRLLGVLSQPLPMVAEPFAAVAEASGVDEEKVIECIRAWKADGTIRRFGARVNHRSLGYTANGMSVWRAPAQRVEEAAGFMVSLDEVTHCYLRPVYEDWPYNLYAMIHGNSEEEVRAVAAHIAEKTGIEDYGVLFSSKEFKKSTPRYFAERGAQPGGPPK